jgi:hypothetical protein
VSLIGVFVTVSGIVVGSDTALRERGSPDFAIASAPKFTACGPSAYAGLTGITRWIVSDGSSKTEFHAIDAVKEVCDQQSRNGQKPSLRSVAEEIRSALVRYVEANYPREGRKLLQRTDEQRLVIAGLENGIAVIYSVSISLARNVASGVETLTGCKFFIGEAAAALALGQGRSPIPAPLTQRPDVVAVRSCNNLSADDARASFRLAVDVSRDYAFEFGLQRGVVNWPIDFGYLDKDGVHPIVREEDPSRR